MPDSSIWVKSNTILLGEGGEPPVVDNRWAGVTNLVAAFVPDLNMGGPHVTLDWDWPGDPVDLGADFEVKGIDADDDDGASTAGYTPVAGGSDSTQDFHREWPVPLGGNNFIVLGNTVQFAIRVIDRAM